MKNVFLLLAFIATLFVGGCGGGSSTPADTTAPTTTAAPAVSGTTYTATTLAVTINENGTGYYLVQLASAAAPTVAQVQAGTSFAMTANVAATPAIGGLIFNTPYTIYFVAMNAANEVQTTVQSVAFTTSATTTAGYVTQGGLTWTPITADTWTNANAYCANTTINGVTGWRQPTQTELSALYTAYPDTSGVGSGNSTLLGQGWALSFTWSSTVYSAGSHYLFNLSNGHVGWNYDTTVNNVSCVR